MRAVKILLTVLLLLGVVWLYGQKIKNYGNELMPVKFVRTEGVFQYLGKDQIKNALLPLVKSGILSADMQAIQEAVAKMPWVDTVSVKRVWPDAIDIKVREKKPFALWGKRQLITEQGLVFTPDSMAPFQSLIALRGPANQQIKTLEIMKGVKTALADKSLELAEFEINERGSWKIELESGMEILLGRSEQLLKLQRFLKTLSVLGRERVDAMAVVDLRYPNGYAVAWKTGSDAIDWGADLKSQVKHREPEKTIKSAHHGKKNRT